MPGSLGNGVCKQRLNKQGLLNLQERRRDCNNSIPVPNKLYSEDFTEPYVAWVLPITV